MQTPGGPSGAGVGVTGSGTQTCVGSRSCFQFFYLSIFIYFHVLLGLFRCFIFVLLISNILIIFFCNLFRGGGGGWRCGGVVVFKGVPKFDDRVVEGSKEDIRGFKLGWL